MRVRIRRLKRPRHKRAQTPLNGAHDSDAERDRLDALRAKLIGRICIKLATLSLRDVRAIAWLTQGYVVQNIAAVEHLLERKE